MHACRRHSRHKLLLAAGPSRLLCPKQGPVGLAPGTQAWVMDQQIASIASWVERRNYFSPDHEEPSVSSFTPLHQQLPCLALAPANPNALSLSGPFIVTRSSETHGFKVFSQPRFHGAILLSRPTLPVSTTHHHHRNATFDTKVSIAATSAGSTATWQDNESDEGSWPGAHFSPITALLWQQRSRLNFSRNAPPLNPNLERPPRESRTTVVYHLSSDAALRERYRNPWGFVRFALILEDLDSLAGTVAFKHCAGREGELVKAPLLVTASVDRISVRNFLAIDRDLTFEGCVAWVGRSSMEIDISVKQKAPAGGEEQEALSARFTFVARDVETGKAVAVCRLLPETDEEKRRFQLGEAEAAKRRESRKKGGDNKALSSASLENYKFEFASRVRALMEASRMLTELPALAGADCVRLDDTRLEAAVVCQPQHRNLHGRIFGGFLLHRAFELAFATAYVFSGTRPVFKEIDHVDFLRPVDIGDLLRFKSCVLYTSKDEAHTSKGSTDGLPRSMIHVEVRAIVTQPEACRSEVSNTFHFTFSIDPSKATKLRNVIPSTEEMARVIVLRSKQVSIQ